jgi:hypothetical protein
MSKIKLAARRECLAIPVAWLTVIDIFIDLLVSLFCKKGSCKVDLRQCLLNISVAFCTAAFKETLREKKMDCRWQR